MSKELPECHSTVSSLARRTTTFRPHAPHITTGTTRNNTEPRVTDFAHTGPWPKPKNASTPQPQPSHLFLYTSMVVSVYFRLMDVLFKDLKKSMSVESFIVLYCCRVFYTTHLHIFLGYLSLLVSMSSNHVVLMSLLDSDMH